MTQYAYAKRDAKEEILGAEHEDPLKALEECLADTDVFDRGVYQIVEVEEGRPSRIICLIAAWDVYWPISHDSARDFIIEDLEESVIGSGVKASE